MKNLLYGVFCSSILMLASCKEKGPVIDFTPVAPVDSTAAPLIDTTYVLTTPDAPQVHNVLAEEFTGANCSNCPAAHEILTAISGSHPGQVNIMAIHFINPNFSQSLPYPGAAYDFRTADGTLIETQVYPSVNLLPNGGIDRIKNGSSILVHDGLWSDMVNTRLATSPPVNITLQSTYNAADTTANIIVTVEYTQAMTTAQNLSIAIVEDSLIDIQECADSVDHHYQFDNILRGLVTPSPAGLPFLTTLAQKEPGRVYQKQYMYKLKNVLVPQHCKVIAFVHDNASDADVEVLQSVQTKLVP